MDRNRLIDALQATTSSTEQIKEATAYLDEVQKLEGIAPLLLQIVVDEQIICTARQAGVIYLKNMISRSWIQDDDEKLSNFVLSEADKDFIRGNIIDAIVATPEALCTSIGIILRHDFPDYWTPMAQKITSLLHSMDGPSWLGALLVIRRLVKLYEYRRVKEKKQLVETMSILMPMLYERLITLMPDNSQESCLLQKIILKVFYGLVQFSLNLEMFSMETLGMWFEQLRLVVERPVPVELENIDEDDRPRTVWWKYDSLRYGSPGQVESDYKLFAEYFLVNHAQRILHTLLAVLDRYRQGEYIAPRVLNFILGYVATAISQARTWKVIKPHCHELICSVLLPLFKYSSDDEDLWKNSPEEYVRLKYDLYSEIQEPVSGATNVLTAAVKRKDILPPVLEFLLKILNLSEYGIKEKDGALRMIGGLSQILLKNKVYFFIS
ncbi:unnamed protein product [Dracunculus medinensis]|uniref:Importin N-terminal domain-containing protein n=1 Tax=Dracunculus medinensis TaxID=318479 RepID=A0A0N4UBS5_DRAME|nr:unnamed protein product [Dracunculus medinensis]